MSGKIEVLDCVEVSFESLNLLSKRVILAMHRSSRRYYVWIEDCDEDADDEFISSTELAAIPKSGSNVYKDRKTAEGVYDYYISVLSEVNSNTTNYFESKAPIFAYSYPKE